MRGKTGQEGNREPRSRDRRWIWYRFRGMAFVPCVGFMLFCGFAEVETDWLVWPVGGAIFVAGFALRVWAQTHLRYRLDTHKVLTTTGPYACVRNPVYIGNTLLLLGLCIMSELLWFALVLLPWCAVVYWHVVRYEESHLLTKYGQPYRQYLEQVPRWLPRQGARGPAVATDARRHLPAGLLVEAHNLLLAVPFILKEFYMCA